MAGSEELGLREDTLRVLAAFLRRGEAAGSPIPTPPRSPAQEEPTDFLSRLRRCLPCPLGRGAVPPESPRPCSLPLRPCYGPQPGPATPDFYALVAQRLEELVQEQLRSPPSPELQGAPLTEKEALLRRLVALLEEEAEVINQKLASDPALHRKLARLSAGSFARLVELFSSREGSPRPSLPCPGPPPPSPEPLARLALAMELSRRVARLGGTLAGLSVEHVHSFTPWIQARGGWGALPCSLAGCVQSRTSLGAGLGCSVPLAVGPWQLPPSLPAQWHHLTGLVAVGTQSEKGAYQGLRREPLIHGLAGDGQEGILAVSPVDLNLPLD